MLWPPWLWISTPVKFLIWLFNRVVTWSGQFYLWKRIRSKRFLWIALINLCSLGILVLIFFWLR